MKYSKTELQEMTDKFLMRRNCNIITGSRKPSKKKLARLAKAKANKKARGF